MMVLDEAAKAGLPLPGRYACLMHDLGKGETPKDILPRHIGHEERSAVLAENVSKRLKVPVYLAELAHLVALEHGNVHQSQKLGGKAAMRLLTRCDAFRRTERFHEMLAACECDARGRRGLTDRPYPQRPRLQYCLAAALDADTTRLVSESLAKGLSGEAIGAKIHRMRTAAVTEALQRWDTAIG